MTITTLTRESPHYPPLLREIAQPPKRLFVRGNRELLEHPRLLAVVGSRHHSEYGRRACEYLLPPLVQSGLVLVSGMAYGIDTLAHRACLEAKQPTIAVLGSGVDDDSLYPSGNRRLAAQILAQGGCLISEQPVGQKARPGFFPARNRIIAGLCRAALIVQAALKSGSLITARLALDANREVAAVPGPVTDPRSFGPHSLIQQGALLVHSPADILALYGLESGDAASTVDISQLSLVHSQLLHHLSAEPQHIETIIELVRLPAHTVSSLLIELEMLGCVANVGGLRYTRVGA